MHLKIFDRIRRMFQQHQEGLRVHGRFVVELHDATGKLKERYENNNLIVDTGFQFISDAIFLSASRPGVMSYIGLGSGSSAAAPTNTALGTQLMRKAFTYSYASYVATASVTFNAGEATGSIQEIGLFNASTAGIMLNRIVLPAPFPKASGDTLVCTFTLTLS